MIDIYPHQIQARPARGFDYCAWLTRKLKAHVLPLSCGRAAMVAALGFWGLTRMDEILVPPFLCQSALVALSRTGFPTMTPSSRTKAVLVYHQFGFPQDLKAIERSARKKGWRILNDCANTIFTKVRGRYVSTWGDAGVLSFSKLYPTFIGGALITHDKKFAGEVASRTSQASAIEIRKLTQVFRDLNAYHKKPTQALRYKVFESHGFLPETLALPHRFHDYLPGTPHKIEADISHRKKIWSLVRKLLPQRTFDIAETELVPFAIPVTGDEKSLSRVSIRAAEDLGVNAPVLHFDFNRNMFDPDYRKALVIGCHAQWTMGIIEKLCHYVKNEYR